jgi:HNH endonuclease
MGRYGRKLLRNIDDPANILPLKVDLHRCFDKRWFAIVPKSMEIPAPDSSQYVTHILLKEAAELWPIYHNTPSNTSIKIPITIFSHDLLGPSFCKSNLLSSLAFHVTLFESR